MFFQINTTDFQKFEEVVQRLEDRFRDLTPFWNDYALGLIQEEVRVEFRTEGHGRWPELNPDYAAEKARDFPGRGILVKEGTYFGAATQVSHPGNIFIATPMEMVYGVDGDYFVSRFGENYPAAHEFGRGVPQREVFEPIAEGAELDAAISRLLEKWSSEEISEAEARY